MSIPLRTKRDLEVVVGKWLPFFFVALSLATILGALQGYSFHNAFRMGDWLINYQGGFVRRGLAGEVAYQLSLLTDINPGIYVLLLQLFFYSLFLYFSYRLLKGQVSLVPLLLLVFSPFLFTFQLNEMQGGYRKEVIYLALLAVNAWSAFAHGKKTFNSVFYATLLLYPLVILSHEMLALFLPYLLCLYLMRDDVDRGRGLRIGLLLVPSIAAFIAAMHYAGTPQHSVDIFKSVGEQGYAVKGGSIGYIGKGLGFALDKVRADASMISILMLAPTLLLALLPFWPVRQYMRSLFSSRTILLLVASSILATAMLFFVAIDWGRFVYIHLVSLFLLLLANRKQPVQLAASERKKPVLPNYWLLFGLIVYFTVWHLGHTTETFSLFAVVNPVNTLFLILFFIRYRISAAYV